MKWVLFAALALVVVAQATIRLWPIPADKWHVGIADNTKANVRFCPDAGSRFDIPAPSLVPIAETAARIERTTLLAGTPAEGHMTWVSRSLIWGFPDVTTAQVVDGRLCIIARQVFGSNDHGVNTKRLNAWIEAAYGINPEL